MACGIFHKASKGFWSAVKGAFGRMGKAIKNTAVKVWDKTAPVLKKVGEVTTNVISKVAAPAGAAIGSLLPGVGTAAGGAIGTAIAAGAGGLNKLITKK